MPDLFASMKAIPEISATGMADIEPHLTRNKPFIVRGLVSQWPIVQAAHQSAGHVRAYLIDHHIDRSFTCTTASEACQGRIFYDENMVMDITMIEAKLPGILQQMAEVEKAENQPVIYLGSVDTGKYFKGLREENKLDLGSRQCMESIWIGTRTCIAAHNDYPQNLACVAAGKRRFTLFPPESYQDLYIGPLENTPAGRPISMVNLHDPDLEAFPRFQKALDVASTSILEPGDAIFIPSMWWHHIDGMDPFNVLINYWWQDMPRYLGQPQDALFHAIMAVRDLPDEQKTYWENLFNHYVFNNSDTVTEHIPFAENTILSKLDAQKANQIRSYLLRALNQ